MDNIRNFSIIAHIDHGKSTLADRIIQTCGGLSDREMEAQVLDSMDLERERGITIKAQTAALQYKALDGKIYNLNLIDTPGHVDFTYAVSRSLAACEGALLVVDASQGVEAQTVANCYTAIDQGVEVTPVLNKIDLPSADPDRVIEEIGDVIGIDATDAIRCSAKTGEGIQDVLETIVSKVPPPKGDATQPLKALIIDAWFDNYVGVVMLVRVVDGVLKPKDKIKLIKEVKPQVFAGLYPVESNQFEALRTALEKLSLNDSSLRFEPENSTALGFGFRCGFLGLLHMDIVQERLEREYDMDLITTAPTVVYELLKRDGEVTQIENPSKLPDTSRIEEIREPIILINLLMPQDYVGPVMTLCNGKRGIQKNMQYLGRQVMLTYEMPLNEVVLDFF